MNNWTEKHIRGLLHDNRIKGYQAKVKAKGYSADKNNVLPEKKSKALVWLEWNLTYFANQRALTLEREYRFDPTRKFRFDFCFPALKIGIEYNGIMSDKSRHTTITGYSKDMDKMNLAQSQGWRVLAYTPLNYMTVLRDLEKILKNKVSL